MNKQKDNLHIIGKVSSLALKKLQKNEHLIDKKSIWLFVGYSFSEYKIGDIFDIVIKESDQAWNHDYKMKLKKVYDEYGTPYSKIPEGFKTICLFECMPSIPAYIKDLVSMKTWEFDTGRSVYLGNHANIDLLHNSVTDTIVFKTLEGIIISNLQQKRKKRFTIKDIEDLLPRESSKLIINNMLISGSIMENNDELVLVG